MVSRCHVCGSVIIKAPVDCKQLPHEHRGPIEMPTPREAEVLSELLLTLAKMIKREEGWE